MNRRQQRLVFFGDSICVGQGVSIHKGWVTRIAARVSERCSRNGTEIVVVNASANGNTTRQALERMPYDVQSHGVDVLLVQFGMNDCNYWLTDHGMPRVSEKAFAANLEEIIVRGVNFGACKVLVNTNHPTTRDKEILPYTQTTYAQSNARYNQIIREVTTLFPEAVILNDVEKYFLSHAGQDRAGLEQFLLPDELHISEEGHNLYYDLIAPAIDNVIKELVSSEK